MFLESFVKTCENLEVKALFVGVIFCRY